MYPLHNLAFHLDLVHQLGVIDRPSILKIRNDILLLIQEACQVLALPATIGAVLDELPGKPRVHLLDMELVGLIHRLSYLVRVFLIVALITDLIAFGTHD